MNVDDIIPEVEGLGRITIENKRADDESIMCLSLLPGSHAVRCSYNNMHHDQNYEKNHHNNQLLLLFLFLFFSAQPAIYFMFIYVYSGVPIYV